MRLYCERKKGTFLGKFPFVLLFDYSSFGGMGMKRFSWS